MIFRQFNPNGGPQTGGCAFSITFPGAVDSVQNPTPGIRLAGADGTVISQTVVISKQFSTPACTPSGVTALLVQLAQIQGRFGFLQVQTLARNFAPFSVHVGLRDSLNTQNQMQQVQTAVSAFQTRAAWVGCQNLLNSMLQSQFGTATVPGTANCMVQTSDPTWGTDACCNFTLAQTQCCVARPFGTVGYNYISSFRTQQIQQLCSHPNQIQTLLYDYVIANQISQNQQLATQNAQQTQWNHYQSFFPNCQTAIFKSCTIDADCLYSKSCNHGNGQCNAPTNMLPTYYAQCLVANAPIDLRLEMAAMWGIAGAADMVHNFTLCVTSLNLTSHVLFLSG